MKYFLDKNMLVTVNSDDPSYFGGFIGDNYFALYKTFNLSKEEIIKLTKNSFEATFLNDEEKNLYYQGIDKFIEENK